MKTTEVWVDTGTGEIFASFDELDPETRDNGSWDRLVVSHPHEDEDDSGRANWMIEQIAGKRHKVELLKQQQRHQLRRLESDLKSFEFLFLEELERLARSDMQASGKKSHHYDFGTARTRSSLKWQVNDEAAAMDWCINNNPDAIKTTRKLLVSKLDAQRPPTGVERMSQESFSINTTIKKRGSK